MKNHHKMIASYNGDERFLDDTVIAGKTGYTSAAKNTLVTVARRSGMTFIVITMHTSPTAETGIPTYTDTALLLNYASENFKKVNAAANETNFLLSKAGGFPRTNFIFEQCMPSFCIHADDSIILPDEADFKDASPRLVFTDSSLEPDTIAFILYTYKDHPVGSAAIKYEEITAKNPASDSEDILMEKNDITIAGRAVSQKHFIIVNIRVICFSAIIISIIISSIFVLYKLIRYIIDKNKFSIKNLYWRQRRRRKCFAAGRKKSIYFKNNYRRASERKGFDDIDL